MSRTDRDNLKRILAALQTITEQLRLVDDSVPADDLAQLLSIRDKLLAGAEALLRA